MIPLIQNNITAIQDACKKYHVKSLYLVGSAMDVGRFTNESDVDFLYRFIKEDKPVRAFYFLLKTFY